MKATVEISMYPLHQDYEERVLAFLKKVNAYPHIQVETNGVSTQLFGDYTDLMEMLTVEMKEVLESQHAMFVMKIGKGELRYE